MKRLLKEMFKEMWTNVVDFYNYRGKAILAFVILVAVIWCSLYFGVGMLFEYAQSEAELTMVYATGLGVLVFEIFLGLWIWEAGKAAGRRIAKENREMMNTLGNHSVNCNSRHAISKTK
jgi:type IV secretory pathway TrbD component